MRLYLLFLYNQIFLSHHPRVFALFLFWKRKTALKEKQARGRENPSFPRTNRSRAPTTSSGTVFSPFPIPPYRGESREDQALPSRASPAIINRSLAGYRSRVHSGKYSERFLYLLGKVADFEAFPLRGEPAAAPPATVE